MLLSLHRVLAVLFSTVLAAGSTHHATASSHPRGHRSTAPAVSDALPSKESCLYSALQVSIFDRFESMVGRQIDCAQVFSNVETNWEQFEHPWFVNYANDANLDWSSWATAPNTNRRLVITLNLFPQALQGSDWLAQGAAGSFDRYATALAQNLVTAGLGNSIIRLAPEMNGTWYDYSLGNRQGSWNLWKHFWNNTVRAMRTVPGEHFLFDWCVSVGTRALPWADIYPGNGTADIIGMDIYDDGDLGTTGSQRWHTLYDEPGGIRSVLAFARKQNRPISIPEWGIDSRSDRGGGDDPAFVDGIAQVVATNPTVYQSYFFNHDNASDLMNSPRSLGAYRAAFGANGYATNRGTDAW